MLSLLQYLPAPPSLPPSLSRRRAMPGPAAAAGCDDGAGADTWWIGVAGTIFGCFVSNFGTNIQKVSLDRNSALPRSRQRSSLRQPLWVAGCFCMVAGAIADFAVLPFAPQSLLAPLATTTLVFNVAMANILSAERPTCTNILATATILAGTVLVVVFGDRCSPTYRADELVRRFEAPAMIVYIAVVSVALLFGVVASVTMDRKAEANRVEMTQRKNVAFVMAAVGGIFGGNTILCAKTVGELIKTSIDALSDDSSTAGLASQGVWNLSTPLFILALVGNLLLRKFAAARARASCCCSARCCTTLPSRTDRRANATASCHTSCGSDWTYVLVVYRGPLLERCAYESPRPICL